MKIGLINTKSLTVTPHLYCLGMAIKNEVGEGTFSSFLANFASLSASEREQKEKELQKYVDELDVICCINNSLPSTLTLKKEQRRILYAIPYDYLFKFYLEELDLEDAFYSDMQSLSCFTEIHYFSQMQLNLLKKLCLNEKTIYKQAIHLPYVMKRSLSTLHPTIKNKKVIGLFTVTGSKIYNCQFDFSALTDFIINLPADCVIITNNSLFFEQARNMPLSFADSFLYVPASVRNVYEMLDEIDILLTDYSAYITSFMRERKPFWLISYKESEFLKYMREVEPTLILKSMDEISIDFLSGFTTEHEKFVERFCISDK